MVEGHGTSCVRVRVPPWAQMSKKLVHSWPTMRADLRNTGSVRRDLQKNEGIPRTIQRVSTKGAVFSTPVIAADETIICGSADGTLYAYNPVSETLLWELQTGEAIDCAAALSAQGYIYAPSCDGKLYTVTTDGEVVRTFDVIHNRTHPTLSSIFWWEGNVSIDDDGNIYAGNDDFYMYSFTPEGDVRWAYATGLNIWTAPAIYKDLVIFCSFDFHAYALNKNTGELVWRTRIDNFCVSSPAISKNGVMYFGTFGGTLYALDVHTGSVLHTRTFNEHVYASAVIHDTSGRLYIGDASGVVRALSLDDLSTVWEVTLEGAVRASAALLEDVHTQTQTLYCADGAGYLYAFTTGGKEMWRYQLVEDKNEIPDICASIALGSHGLATATASGDIIWIPYEWTPEVEQKVEQNTHTSTKTHDSDEKRDWAGDYSCTVQNVIFKNPPIISSFDLVAIASVTYHLQFSVDSGGIITGIGTAMFGSDEGADGVTIARTLSYTLEGEFQSDGSFSIRAHNCMFELSAFPLPIDTLTFSGVVEGTTISNRVVTLVKRKKRFVRGMWELIQPQSLHFLWGYVRQLVTSGVLFKKPTLVGHTLIAVARVLHPRTQRAWNLQNTQGDIIAHGTYTSSELY